MSILPEVFEKYKHRYLSRTNGCCTRVRQLTLLRHFCSWHLRLFGIFCFLLRGQRRAAGPLVFVLLYHPRNDVCRLRDKIQIGEKDRWKRVG